MINEKYYNIYKYKLLIKLVEFVSKTAKTKTTRIK